VYKLNFLRIHKISTISNIVPNKYVSLKKNLFFEGSVLHKLQLTSLKTACCIVMRDNGTLHMPPSLVKGLVDLKGTQIWDKMQ
jgi:hypothetical protein